MPKTLEWKKLITCTNADEFFASLPQTVVHHSNKSKCSICTENITMHSMQTQYRNCSAEACQGACNVRYKALKCENNPNCFIYSFNEHKQAEALLFSSNRHGIEEKIKEIINNLIENKNIRTPSKILKHLSFNQELYGIKNLPKLTQIQNYAKHNINQRNKLSITCKRLSLEKNPAHNYEVKKQFFLMHNSNVELDLQRLNAFGSQAACIYIHLSLYFFVNFFQIEAIFYYFS